jgi:hypothetical protein
MKLYKEIITPENAIPPQPEFIMESQDRDELKHKAKSFAARDYGLKELVWDFEGDDKGYTQLVVNNQCRFVIRS